MQNDLNKSLGAWLGAAALMLLSATSTQAQGQLPGSSVPRYTADRSRYTVDTVVDQKGMANDYWLGLGCAPVQGALRAQINVPDGQGLVVEELVADGPAAKAGVKQYDILLKAAQKPLRKVEDLAQAIEAAKGKKLTLEMLRSGKTSEIEVTPEKRPEDAYGVAPRSGPFSPETERIFEWLERTQPGAGGRPPMRFRFYHPGTILPPQNGKREPMPENMSVTITKQGKAPARITVHQADKTWEVKEGELDKLPADVRPHVERMLSRLAKAQPEDDDVITFVPKLPDLSSGNEEGRDTAAQGRLEKRLDELNRRMDEMRKSIDQLRARRPD